ncbi:MAG: DUF1778 domain-containing protein [Candidatus Hydrogenedentes bacterium]|nr:DUF1778 domain-containing protein [Candidatus Hydrogenedentota bacterium]
MIATRLDIRLKPDIKELIQQAAELRNQTITQFAIATLSEEAGKVVAEHQRTVLSDRDRDLFLKLLDAPPKPNKALRKAAEKYRRQLAQ